MFFCLQAHKTAETAWQSWATTGQTQSENIILPARRAGNVSTHELHAVDFQSWATKIIRPNAWCCYILSLYFKYDTKAFLNCFPSDHLIFEYNSPLWRTIILKDNIEDNVVTLCFKIIIANSFFHPTKSKCYGTIMQFLFTILGFGTRSITDMVHGIIRL